MKLRLLAAVSLLAVCFTLSAVGNASPYTPFTISIPEFSGGNFPDPGPFPSYTVATIVLPTSSNYSDIALSGTFGNSIVDTSAGVDLFFGNINVGFSLVGQCFEFDPCWTGPGPTPWSADLGFMSLPAGSYYFIASQTSGDVVRLGVTDITFSPIPEPSSLTLLGTGLLGVVGVVRRKFLS